MGTLYAAVAVAAAVDQELFGPEEESAVVVAAAFAKVQSSRWRLGDYNWQAPRSCCERLDVVGATYHLPEDHSWP